MDLFDSHCHLDPMRARAGGVTGRTVIGTRAADSEAAAELAAREPGIVAAAGIHPNDVAEAEPGEWDRIVRLAASGRAAAVGETGLDWYRTTAPAEVQRDFFDRHVRLAQRHGLPLVIHTRESTRDVLDLLREARARGPFAAVLHSFTGTAAEAAEAIDLGCHLGFAGMVTFRSSGVPARCRRGRCRSTGCSSRPTVPSSPRSRSAAGGTSPATSCTPPGAWRSHGACRSKRWRR